MTDSRLDRMRANPVGDWAIEDVAALCREYAIRCTPPSGGGSHWKVSDPTQRDILTVPNRRPIKPVYIRRLARFVDSVRKARDAKA
jgi:hypothetical protein